MAARDDRDIIALPDADFLDGCREQVAIDLVRLREARPVRKGRAVVRYRNLEAEVGGVPAERPRDIAAAEQNQPLVRQEIARQLPALRFKVQRRRQTSNRFMFRPPDCLFPKYLPNDRVCSEVRTPRPAAWNIDSEQLAKPFFLS